VSATLTRNLPAGVSIHEFLGRHGQNALLCCAVLYSGGGLGSINRIGACLLCQGCYLLEVAALGFVSDTRGSISDP
jgi:hypothetical protein